MGEIVFCAILESQLCSYILLLIHKELASRVYVSTLFICYEINRSYHVLCIPLLCLLSLKMPHTSLGRFSSVIYLSTWAIHGYLSTTFLTISHTVHCHFMCKFLNHSPIIKDIRQLTYPLSTVFTRNISHTFSNVLVAFGRVFLLNYIACFHQYTQCMFVLESGSRSSL